LLGGSNNKEYYEILCLDNTASAADIKKSYYKLARQYHPDKNPGDNLAADKFKKVSEAYQVLSDPALREKYDKFGKDGVQPEGGFVNPKTFFSAMFGGGKFEDIFGEMTLTMNFDDDVTPEQKEQLQNERVAKLTKTLSKKLDVFVEGKGKEFEENAKKECEELKTEAHGVELLNAIGYIYEQEGKQHLGGIFGFAAEFTEKAHLIGETVSAVKAAVKLQQSQKDIQEADEEKKAHLEQQFVTDGMQAIWKLGKLELEATLRRVCENVLRDQEVDKPTLKKRAEALKALGKVYKATKA